MSAAEKDAGDVGDAVGAGAADAGSADAGSARSGDLAAAKRELRALVRAARCALEPGFCADAAASVAERLLALPELRAARIVLAYAATAEEIDPAQAVEALHGAGKSVALPRVEAPGVLGIHLWVHGDELEAGPFSGILQPLESAPRVPLAAIDAVIVPGVAFDFRGRRLGYGGGFYDRLLPQLRPDCMRIGLAYDEQIAEALPVAEHDAHVRIVVTPTRVAHAGQAHAGQAHAGQAHAGQAHAGQAHAGQAQSEQAQSEQAHEGLAGDAPPEHSGREIT